MSRTDPLPRVALVAAIWLAAALRVYHLDFHSIWWDEGHSIAMAAAPLNQIATQPGMDVHPPGYFWALHLWSVIFGSSEFSLRFPSLLLGLVTVSLTARFARDLLVGSKNTAWYAAALTGLLAAIYPFWIALAQEVRMYAAIVFLATLSTYALWRLVAGIHTSRSAVSRWQWLSLYVVATAAALYTHYFFVFVLVVHNLVCLIWVLVASPSSGERRPRFLIWLATQAGALILFAPQMRFALAQTTAYANPNLLPPSLIEYGSRCWQAFSTGQAAAASLLWAEVLLAGISVLLVALLAGTSPRPVRAQTCLLLGWSLVPVLLYFVVLLYRPSFEPRYLAPITPAILLLWGWGIVQWATLGSDATHPHWQRPLAIATACVSLLALGAGTHSYFTNTEAFKDDTRGVVAWLATNSTAQDIVYVDVPHPFHYYAERIPAPTEYLFVEVYTVAERLSAEASGRQRLFWVTWRGSDTDPRGIVPFLLDKAGRRLGERDFRGYHVTWWQLPSQPVFSLPLELAPASSVFGDVLSLDGIAFNDAVEPGGSVFVTAHFRLTSPTELNLRASLRLRDANGNMLPPADKDLLNDRHFRSSAWPVDDPRLNQAFNVYTLLIPPETPPGDYQLEMVVYDAVSLNPVWVSDLASADGVSAYLGLVRVLP